MFSNREKHTTLKTMKKIRLTTILVIALQFQVHYYVLNFIGRRMRERLAKAMKRNKENPFKCLCFPRSLIFTMIKSSGKYCALF